MNFLQYYMESVDKERTYPFSLDDINITEDDEIELVITKRNFREMVKHGLIDLYKEGKSYKIDEAINHLKEKDDVKKNVDPTTTYKDPEEGLIKNFEVALGNAKIGGDTIILNMSSAKDCMSAIIGTCKLGPDGKCYALRFEKQWPVAIAKNIRHQKQWSCLSPLAIAKGLINITNKMKNIKFVRINEAGEFRNLPTNPELLSKVPDVKKAELAEIDDVSKLKSIGKFLIELGSDLTLYTYTHRHDLNIGNLGSNICVNGSGWMIDNAFIPLEFEDFVAILDKIEKKELKEFNGEPVKLAVHCLGDCRVCKFCKVKNGKHIFLPIHGHSTTYQLKLEEIINNVAKNPEVEKILATSNDNKQKAKDIINTLSDEDRKLFRKLIPLENDRIDLFKNLISSNANAEEAKNLIIKYVNAKSEKNAAFIGEKQSLEGLVASIDSLTGDFKANIDNAIKLGRSTSQYKWERLLGGLENIIQTAKAGGSPKVSKVLAKKILSKVKKG